MHIRLILHRHIGIDQFARFPARVGIHVMAVAALHNLGMVAIAGAGTAERLHIHRVGIIQRGWETQFPIIMAT